MLASLTGQERQALDSLLTPQNKRVAKARFEKYAHTISNPYEYVMKILQTYRPRDHRLAEEKAREAKEQSRAERLQAGYDEYGDQSKYDAVREELIVREQCNPEAIAAEAELLNLTAVEYVYNTERRAAALAKNGYASYEKFVTAAGVETCAEAVLDAGTLSNELLNAMFDVDEDAVTGVAADLNLKPIVFIYNAKKRTAALGQYANAHNGAAYSPSEPFMALLNTFKADNRFANADLFTLLPAAFNDTNAPTIVAVDDRAVDKTNAAETAQVKPCMSGESLNTAVLNALNETHPRNVADIAAALFLNVPDLINNVRKRNDALTWYKIEEGYEYCYNPRDAAGFWKQVAELRAKYQDAPIFPTVFKCNPRLHSIMKAEDMDLFLRYGSLNAESVVHAMLEANLLGLSTYNALLAPDTRRAALAKHGYKSLEELQAFMKKRKPEECSASLTCTASI